MSASLDDSQSSSQNCYPFRQCSFKRVGNHLPRCPQRDGRDYTIYLSQKTLNNRAGTSKKKPCPSCGKLFIRLDTHLKNSAICKSSTLLQPMQASQSQPPDSSQTVDTRSSQDIHTSVLVNHLPVFELLPPFKTPKTDEKWREDNSQLAEVIIPAVAEAQSVDDKNRILCEGIYHHFASKYGVMDN